MLGGVNMPEDGKSPKATPSVEKQNSAEPSSGDPGKGLGETLASLVSKLPFSIRRYGTIAVVVVMALLVVGVMRNFAAGVQQSRQAELRATAQALAQPTIDAVTGGEAAALMPSFSAAASQFEEGITRLASLDTIIPTRARVEIKKYIVQQGDTLFGIADLYHLKPESILWFNFDVLNDNPNDITPGQEINIPPVDGVLHTYHTGESLVTIADNYSYSTKTTAQAIVEWPGNHLDPFNTNFENPDVPDGTQLIIPGGSRLLRDWGPPAVTRDNPAAAAYYGPGSCGAIASGAVDPGPPWTWPTVLKYLSGFDYTPPTHYGIDIAGAEGNAIYAAGSGVVVYAGVSNFGYGNLLVIDHGNGWQTAYGHLSAIYVGCGQDVTRGEVVAALGSTGNSTGPHLHFEVHSALYGKVNPWDYLIQ
jgi:murein DD-endopeptidase MepM/ murein hydrolase activator NlpD